MSSPQLPPPPVMSLAQLEKIGRELSERVCEEETPHPSTRDAVELYREVVRLRVIEGGKP